MRWQVDYDAYESLTRQANIGVGKAAATGEAGDQ
jgi:hypothetical protein